jgi:hypothetical protein
MLQSCEIYLNHRRVFFNIEAETRMFGNWLFNRLILLAAYAMAGSLKPKAKAHPVYAAHATATHCSNNSRHLLEQKGAKAVFDRKKSLLRPAKRAWFLPRSPCRTIADSSCRN